MKEIRKELTNLYRKEIITIEKEEETVSRITSV